MLNEETSVLKRGCWAEDFHRHVSLLCLLKSFFFLFPLPLLEPENCPVSASSPVTFKKIEDGGGLFFL